MLKKILPWFGWGLSSLFVLFQFLLQTSTSVMIHDLEKAFSIDVLGVSLLASSFFYTYLVLQIPAGMIVDRFGVRMTLTAGLLLAAVACFIFAQTHFLSLAVASRIILGIASAPGVVSALYLAARCFPARYFALIAGLMECLGMLGGVAGESLMARFIGAFGWRDTLLGCAWIALLMGILTWIIVRDRFDILIETNEESNQKNSWKNLLSVLRLPQAWINGFFAGTIFAILAAFAGFWCVPYLMNRYGVTLSSAADASAITFLGAAFGAPLLGWLSDHLEQRKSLMIFVTAISLLLTSIILYVPTIPFSYMYFLLFALGVCSGVYVLPFAVMRDITPHHVRATAMGYTNMMCIVIGAPFLQPFIGWILSQKLQVGISHVVFSQYQCALVVLPMSLFVALILAFFVRETGDRLHGIIPS